jgi:hypothetical protein
MGISSTYCLVPDLAASREKGLEDRGALRRENSMGHFYLMIEAWAGENFEARACCATLGIVGAINEAGDAGLDYGSGTHAAGFNGDVQRCAGHAVVAEKARCFTNHHDLGVRCGVAITNCAVARAGENPTVEDDERANGDFAGGCCSAPFLHGYLHEQDVCVHILRENNTRKGEGANQTKHGKTEARKGREPRLVIFVARTLARRKCKGPEMESL